MDYLEDQLAGQHRGQFVDHLVGDPSHPFNYFLCELFKSGGILQPYLLSFSAIRCHLISNYVIWSLVTYFVTHLASVKELLNDFNFQRLTYWLLWSKAKDCGPSHILKKTTAIKAVNIIRHFTRFQKGNTNETKQDLFCVFFIFYLFVLELKPHKRAI